MRAASTFLVLTAAILLITGSSATAASPEEIAAQGIVPVTLQSITVE